MSDLEDFVIKTQEGYKKDLKDFKEFQDILKSLNDKKKITYVRHEISSNV